MLTRLVFCLFSPADFFMGLRLWRFSDLAERCEEFTFVYPARGEGTKETAQLALYEQYARMFGFETPDGKLPVALLNERKRQRGETDVEDAAVEPPPKMDVFAYMEKVARLAPQGAKYLKLPDGGDSLAAAALAGAVVPVVAAAARAGAVAAVPQGGPGVPAPWGLPAAGNVVAAMDVTDPAAALQTPFPPQKKSNRPPHIPRGLGAPSLFASPWLGSALLTERSFFAALW